MIFFFDENMPSKLAHMLDLYDRDHEVRALMDYFERGTPDIQWISDISQWDKQPVIVGGDGRILKNKVEKKTLKEAKLTFVYLASGWVHLSWHDWAWKMVKVWPKIVSDVEHSRNPMLLEVSAKLKITSRGRICDL